MIKMVTSLYEISMIVLGMIKMVTSLYEISLIVL